MTYGHGEEERKEDTMLDDPDEVLPDNLQPGQSSKEAPKDDQKDIDYEKRTLDAIMGFEGGEGWYWNDTGNTIVKTEALDDPLANLSLVTVAKVVKARVDDTLWEEEDLKPEEVPDKLKESGAIALSLRDVRGCIGKDREQ